MLLHYLGKLKNQKFALCMHVKHVSSVTFYHLSSRYLPNVMKICAINTMQNINILFFVRSLSMPTSWTTPQSDSRVLLSLDNRGLSWTASAPDKVTAVPVRRPVFLRWDPNNVTHCRILPTDKTTRWLLQTTLCRRWCCCLDDQLWLLNAYATTTTVLNKLTERLIVVWSNFPT